MKRNNFPSQQPSPFPPASGPCGGGKIRFGKTRRDREAGNQQQNHQNKIARARWSRGDDEVFPSGTCNGKKSRALRGEK